jgi:hypothetical protein
LRGDRTRNVRKKKNENKAGKPEAPDQFSNFSGASVRLNISPAKPARREKNKIHPLSPGSMNL